MSTTEKCTDNDCNHQLFKQYQIVSEQDLKSESSLNPIWSKLKKPETVLATITAHYVLENKKLATMEANLNGRWQKLTVNANHIYGSNLEILSDFENCDTHNEIIAIDDLFGKRDTCDGLNCNFYQSSCGWYTPQEELLSSGPGSNRWLYLEKQNTIAMKILDASSTYNTGVMYAEFSKSLLGSHGANLVSTQVAIKRKAQCLKFSVRFDSGSFMQLHVFTQDARKRVRLMSLKAENDSWFDTEVDIPGLSQAEFTQEVFLVAYFQGEQQVNPQNSNNLINYVAIRSILLSERSCVENANSSDKEEENETNLIAEKFQAEYFQKVFKPDSKTKPDNYWAVFVVLLITSITFFVIFIAWKRSKLSMPF